MNTFSLLGLLLALLGCAAIYLASGNQRWIAAPWRVGPARLAGALLLVAGGISLAQAMLIITTVFVLATVMMLALAVFPYLGALRNLHRKQ